MSEAEAPCRVVVADDTAALRMMLRMALQRDPRFELVGEAADSDAVVVLSTEHQPDAVILDLNMPPAGGLGVLPSLLAASPGTRVLVLSGHDDEDLRRQALALGADRYLVKGAPLREVLDVLVEICQPS